MFYAHKNCLLTIENKSFIVRDLELTTQADVVPVYDVTSPFNSNYAANNGLQGILKLSYYLTGEDLLKTYLNFEGSTSLSANFAGLTISNGYVRTYQINMVPNEPIVANAEIIFFDKIDGTFTPNTSPVSLNNIPLMHVSDVTLNSSESAQSIGNVVGINYSFTNDIKSSFNVNSNLNEENIAPDRVFFGIKESRIEIVTDEISPSLPIYGQPKVGAIVTLQTPDGSTTDTLVCSGHLLAKSISSSVGQSVQSKLSVVTNNLRNRMAITSFTPTAGSFYDIVTIYGEGLDLVTAVYFGDKETSLGSANYPITIISPTEIRVAVPVDALTNPIRLRSIYGDTVISTDSFTVNVPTPSIISATEFSLNGSQTKNYTIFIEGANIYRPSRVVIGGDSCTFFQSKQDRNIVVVRPPAEAANSYITLYEDDYGYSAVSPNKVKFPAFLRSISPITGKPGDTITVAGRNLTDMTNAYFKNTNDNTLISATLSVSNDTTALITVPNGNVNYSDIVFSYSSISTADLNEPSVSVLDANFWPATSITGFHPPLVGVTQNLRISGFNFQDAVMYSDTTDVEGKLYDVYFNSVKTRFRRISDTLMTGYVPTSATTGPVGIRANHSQFHLFKNTNIELSIRGYPTITRVYASVFPYQDLTIYYGRLINGIIEGTYLETATTVRFVGVAGEALANGETFDLTFPTDFKRDPNGKRLILEGASSIGKDLGEYSISVLNDIGWGNADSNNRLEIVGIYNLARLATARLSHPSVVDGQEKYPASKVNDGIIGTFVGYQTTFTTLGTNRYVELTWSEDVLVSGYEVFLPEDYLRVVTQFDIYFYDKDGNQLMTNYLGDYAITTKHAKNEFGTPYRNVRRVKVEGRGSLVCVITEIRVF